jgi:hypothetical protein
MGMDTVGSSGAVHLSWAAWSELQEMLRANGFTGSLPESNDEEMLTSDVAKQVGRAMLPWYRNRDQDLPLSAAEGACLAYALLLCCDDGECEHG